MEDTGELEAAIGGAQVAQELRGVSLCTPRDVHGKGFVGTAQQ